MDYKKKLEALKESASELEKEVIDDALNADDAASYLGDVLTHGCQSGIVSGLIYYRDTDAFFKKHMDEIEEIRVDMQEQLGEPLNIGTPLYNWLAWFGYEETARKIALAIGMTDV